MVFSSTSNISSDRISLYVEELRQFSGIYRIPVEQPQSLQMLCDRLTNDQSFLLDFQSMMRTIAYQEKCQVASSDLLVLVGLAWGGPGGPDLTKSTQSPACDVATFVRQAMKFPHLGPAESKDTSGLADKAPDELSNVESISIPLGRPLTGKQFPVTSEPAEGRAIDVDAGTAGQLQPDTSRETPWWAEPKSDGTVSPTVHERQSFAQREPGSGQEDERPTSNPWANNSAFYRELLQFEARRNASNTAKRPAAVMGNFPRQNG